MKIEKINENQIRCTLTREDLAKRELKLSELAYGSEKAKSLFHDMMQQAEEDFGFRAEDIPLMIEAIPASPDTIVLIITKVEDPEELDTRFSKFAPSVSSDSPDSKSALVDRLKKLDGAEDFLNLFRQVKESVSDPANAEDLDEIFDGEPAQEKEEEENAAIRFFSFSSLDSAIRASRLLIGMYDGSNTLYRDRVNEIYVLALTQSMTTMSDFNKICNMLSEYGSSEPGTGASLAYLEEHCDVITAKDAIQVLGNL